MARRSSFLNFDCEVRCSLIAKFVAHRSSLLIDYQGCGSLLNFCFERFIMFSHSVGVDQRKDTKGLQTRWVRLRHPAAFLRQLVSAHGLRVGALLFHYGSTDPCLSVVRQVPRKNHIFSNESPFISKELHRAYLIRAQMTVGKLSCHGVDKHVKPPILNH